MTAFAILRHSKLKSFGEIGGSLSHTYRTRNTPNADSERTCLNENQFEKSEQVLEAIKARLPEKLRKDNVLCVEYLITTSPDWDGIGTVKEQQFFNDSLSFLKKKWGADNVISSHIHRDETTPHMVVYIVPLDETTQKLNCKKWLGGKSKLSQQQTDFANEVKHLGLERGLEGSKAEHISIKKYYASVENTLANMPEVDFDYLPAPGFFESKVDYASRAINELMPGYQAAAIRANEVDANKRELQVLREQVKDAKPYLDAIQHLPLDYKNKLDEVVQSASNRITALYEKHKQEKFEQYENFKDKYNDFENYVTNCISNKNNFENEIEKRGIKTEKWLRKKNLTHDEISEDQRRLGGPVYDIPDYYISPYNIEFSYTKSYKDFKKKVVLEAETANIEGVISFLKENSTESNVIPNFELFEECIQPLVNESKIEIRKRAERDAVEEHMNKLRSLQEAKNERIQKEALEEYQAEKKAEYDRFKAIQKHSNNDVERKVDRDNDLSM